MKIVQKSGDVQSGPHLVIQPQDRCWEWVGAMETPGFIVKRLSYCSLIIDNKQQKTQTAQEMHDQCILS